MNKNTPQRGNVPADGNPFEGKVAARSMPVRGVAEAAVVSGEYAADLCAEQVSAKGRECLSLLKAVKVDDLVALKLLRDQLRPTDDDVAAWHEQRDRIWNPPTRTATGHDVKAAVAGIDPTARRALADILSAANEGQHWAARLVDYARARNKVARRERYSDRPLLFSPGDLLAHGVAVEAITALPKATTASHGESADIIETWDAQDRAQAARRARAARAAQPAPPQPLSLTELLAEPDDEAQYRIGELWPVGGRVLLAAPYKAGKSTLVGNLIRSLVDGDKFLGRFGTTKAGRVVLIDTELDRRTMRRWLRDQRIVNTDAVTVIPLRGAVSTFDITDATIRAEWARRIGETDVLILDCLRPVLDAIGLSESTEAGRLLTAFDELLAVVGAEEAAVVTHMGHQNERARGDSRLLDWPDALWNIIRGGNAENDSECERPRHFSAMGRDVDVREGLLNFDTATRHLSYREGSRKDYEARAAMPELMALVRSEPGQLSKNAAQMRLQEDRGMTQKAARAAITAAIKGGYLTATPGPRNAQLLSLGADPFASLDS